MMTKEELEKENLALKGQLKELSEIIVELEGRNQSSADSKKVEALMAENEALKEQLKELADHVKTTEVSHEANRVVIKHKTKSYFVNAPQFRHNGEVYKAKELSKFPEVIEDLL
ncbi:MAG TPA: hypothetical protein VFV48_02425, partial [Pseudomonadales bacterium]|nr:hypothetical protein [Pseudomonadales bacterium]